MKILLVSAFFYPQNVIACARVGQWAKYWAREGHEVFVLTTKKYNFWHLDNKVELPSNVHIYEVKFLPNFLTKYLFQEKVEKISDCKKNNLFKLKCIKLIHLISRNFIDLHFIWVIPAVVLGLKLAKSEKFDSIISSYSPAASHIIACIIKLFYSNAYWIADFRDLWSQNHLVSQNYLSKYINGLFESAILKRVNLITTISDGLAEKLSNKHNVKVATIENGYDPEEHINWVNGIVYKSVNRYPVVMTYTGMVYEKKRDPTPLFKAVNNLIDSGKISSDSLEINFYGSNVNILKSIIDEGNYNKHKIIKLKNQVSREESIKIQKLSNILIFLEWNDISAKGVLTGKLFEYIVSGRPIIGVGVDQTTASGNLIFETKTGYATLDVGEIEKLIYNYILRGEFNNFSPNIEKISKYSRPSQANRILSFVK